jgi:hypothetical protein
MISNISDDLNDPVQIWSNMSSTQPKEVKADGKINEFNCQKYL